VILDLKIGATSFRAQFGSSKYFRDKMCSVLGFYAAYKSQKSQYLIYTAAEAGNHAHILVVIPPIPECTVSH